MLKVYRILLRMYPTAFREAYADLMDQELRDELAETPKGLAIAWLWMRMLFDFALSLPTQLAIEIGQDSRHALRLWAKRPWHTGFAVVALGVAIGVNTGVFSVVNALLLRSLPFRDPGNLAAMTHFMPPHDSTAQFDRWRQHSNYLGDAALYEEGDINVGDAERMLRAHIAMTSDNFFSLLGARSVLGRTLAPGDHGVAVISYALWQDLYAGSDQVLGKIIRVHGLQPHPDDPLTIIGVMSAGFDFPPNTALWKAAEYTHANNGWVAIGRLKPGISWTQARASFQSDANQLDPPRRSHANRIRRLVPLQEQLAGHVRNASLLLMGVVVLTLLIACANLANLMLARTVDRQHELAIRSAVGASRARLCQQVLTECLLLAVVSACLGFIVALWATSLASKVQPAALPSQGYTILDTRVLAFTLSLAAVSALLFGLLPALSVGRNHTFAARGSAELRRSRFVHDALVTAQVMLTIILLAGTVSVVRAVSHELQIDRGFRAEDVVTASVSLDGTVRGKPGLRLQYFEEVLDSLRHVPGVQSASSTEFLPLLSGRFLGGPYAFDGHPSPQGSGTDIIPIMADYFRTTGGHMLYGREFTDAEVRSNANVVLVNETFARLWLEPADAVGHTVTGPDKVARKIIGVVRNLDFMGQYISDVFDVDPAETFIPAHNPGGFDSTFVVKVTGGAERHVPSIRAVLQAVDRGVPVYGVETMQHRMDRAFVRPKFYRTALVFFTCFALLLALVGIYAVVAYAVTQRTHEMGVRLALGTTPVRLRTRFIRHGVTTVFIGTFVGFVCAASGQRLLNSLIEGAQTLDFATAGLATLSICFISASSIWVATRRITNLDVLSILRAE